MNKKRNSYLLWQIKRTDSIYTYFMTNFSLEYKCSLPSRSNGSAYKTDITV